MKKIFTLCFLLGSFFSEAQITFTNYTDADGLINNSTNCLAIDANDGLWVGTQKGLSYFDYTTWTNYDKDNYPDLVDDNITALAVDSDNNLWIGTDFGVNKFDGSNWTAYTTADGLADDRVKYINQSADGRIWIANNDGISILDGTTWTSYTMSDGIPFGGTNFVTFDGAGNAWLGTPLAGVLVFDGTSFTEISETEGLLSNKVRSIAVNAEQEKWIGTADGISVFDADNNFVQHHELIFALPPPDLLNPVEDVQIDQAGRIWVGVYVDYLVTEGGISLLRDDVAPWEDYDVADGLIGPVVRRLAIDSKNIVWVSTSTGLSRIGGFTTSTFDIATDNEIKVFPNPASGEINIDLPNDLMDTDYQLFNTLGMLIKDGNIDNQTMTISTSDLAAGVYFLTIDHVYTRKVLIKK